MTHKELMLKSNFGYISPNTVEAAIRRLRKEDPQVREKYQRGQINNSWVLYLETSLSLIDINRILTNFIQRYDYLYFNVTSKG